MISASLPCSLKDVRWLRSSKSRRKLEERDRAIRFLQSSESITISSTEVKSKTPSSYSQGHFWFKKKTVFNRVRERERLKC